MDELWARPGSFWLVFTCLAVDANVEKMRRVINEIDRREPCESDREELYLALATLAELDPWGHDLHKEIKKMLQMLHHQLVRHLQRELTPSEREALSLRADRLSSAEAANLLSQATPSSLLRWLFGPNAA